MISVLPEISRNLIGRPNVFHDVNTEGRVLLTSRGLYDALDELVRNRPNWRFVVNSTYQRNGAIEVRGFTITEDGEELGTIFIAYKGRGYKLCVENKRIKDARENGRGYFTEDPAKAALAIRKNFFPSSKDERIDEALVEAAKVVRTEVNGKGYKVHHLATTLLSKAEDFARANLEAYMTMFPELREVREKHKAEVAENIVMRKIASALEYERGVLVVLHGTHYIVKVDGEPATVASDSELSYETKRKLGLLKLVKNKQMVSDVGCRVSDSVFFLLSDAVTPTDTELTILGADDE